MIEQVTSFLTDKYSSTYLSKSKQDRKEIFLGQNIALTFSEEIPTVDRNTEIAKLEKLGFSTISLRFILAGFSYISKNEGREIPYPQYSSIKDVEGLSKKARTDIISQQDQYANSISSRVVISKEPISNVSKIGVLNSSGDIEDITEKTRRFLTETDDDVEFLYNNRICLGKAIGILKTYMDKNTGILAILDAPIINQKGPSIQIDGINKKSFNQKQADRVLNSGDMSTQHFGIIKETLRFSQIKTRREALQEKINDGSIRLTNSFKRDKWPSHPLMNRIKALSVPLIVDEVKKSGILCDEQDIRYQTLFRLATYPLDKLFNHGEQLQEELLHQGSFYSWSNIPKISDVLLEQYEVQEELVRHTVREQLIIINDRLKNSDLPLDQILIPSGIFTEINWMFLKSNNELFITNKDSGKRMRVEFRQVENNLATSFHRDLHYIHTPRSGTSFGLFLEDDNLPFSVLAIEKIDRKYKENVLLALGYDPEHCVDFTRLYSRPGVPFNTSSAIFACAFQYIEKNYPDIQAALSAFMPTYASGLSMISGGFDTPVIIKEGRQTFQPKLIDGKEVWEHVTARRKDIDIKSIRSAIPMFPTVELLRTIKKPRFEPLSGIKGKMFEI